MSGCTGDAVVQLDPEVPEFDLDFDCDPTVIENLGTNPLLIIVFSAVDSPSDNYVEFYAAKQASAGWYAHFSTEKVGGQTKAGRTIGEDLFDWTRTCKLRFEVRTGTITCFVQQEPDGPYEEKHVMELVGGPYLHEVWLRCQSQFNGSIKYDIICNLTVTPYVAPEVESSSAEQSSSPAKPKMEPWVVPVVSTSAALVAVGSAAMVAGLVGKRNRLLNSLG
jgi:hypothetical protein